MHCFCKAAVVTNTRPLKGLPGSKASLKQYTRTIYLRSTSTFVCTIPNVFGLPPTCVCVCLCLLCPSSVRARDCIIFQGVRATCLSHVEATYPERPAGRPTDRPPFRAPSPPSVPMSTFDSSDSSTRNANRLTFDNNYDNDNNNSYNRSSSL